MNVFSSYLTNLPPIILAGLKLISIWWWVLLPFVLWRPFKFFWRWWRIEHFLSKTEVTLLEIRPPKEILKPIRAMEGVLGAMRQALYKPADWWEKWVDGEVQLSYAFEIASIDGETHFFIRTPDSIKNAVIAAVYSQYPDAEISEVEDYTKRIPSNIPNDEWDLWASDYRLLRPNSFPIKTYTEFETEHEVEEEKRIDPISALLEAMAHIKTGENLWIQILAEPISPPENKWIKEGMELKDLLARRVKKEKPLRPLILDAADFWLTGNVPSEKKEEKELIPPEMKLTPGEREIITAVEKKISKPGFSVSMRFVYLADKKHFNKLNSSRGVFGFFALFFTENLNAFIPWGQTMTKIHKSWFVPINFFYKRRLYLRKRKILRRYVRRDGPYFPRLGRYPGNFVLNLEEMASIFHFPGRSSAAAPYVSRTEAKKGEAPSDLPIE